MYVRPPENKKIRLPENYRGNAFGTSGEYTDMPPPIRISHPSYDLPPEDVSNAKPYNEDIPKIESRNKDEIDKSPTFDELTEPVRSEIPPLTLPSDTSRFPFGHGIGAEELLILGMMLLIFSQGSEQGEVDNHLILMLALLLFSG